MLLVDDDTGWHEAAVARVASFRGPALRNAQVMARCHPYAADYIEQFPALVYFVPGGFPQGSRWRPWLATVFGGIVNRQPKLKHLAAERNIPLPLRAVLPGAINTATVAGLRAACAIPPSDLAQCIPSGIKKQSEWLHEVEHWSRIDLSRNGLFLWGSIAAGRAIRDGAGAAGTARTLWDYMTRGRNVIDPKWSLQTALHHADRWHEDLAKDSDAQRFERQHGCGFHERLNSNQPDETIIDGFTFKALATGSDLHAEGRAMRHCVASYAKDVQQDRCWIFSVSEAGDRRATIEIGLGRTKTLRQAKGRCNSTPRGPVRAAIDKFVAHLNTKD